MAAMRHHKVLFHAFPLILIFFEFGEVHGDRRIDTYGSQSKTTAKPKTATECKPTSTIINGATLAKCAGELIFEENFGSNDLDMKKWKLERRFTTEPDYEFNMYVDELEGEVDDVVDTFYGFAHLKPKLTKQHFSDIDEHRDLDLGLNCSGRIDTDECYFHAKDGKIWPPLITGQFSTKGLFSFKYGRVEIYGSLPQALWTFPQLWLQPVEHVYGIKDYQSGQIRIAYSQMNGEKMDLSAGLLLNAGKLWRSEMMCSISNWDDYVGLFNFHYYTMTWTEHYISFEVDGEEYCRFYETKKTGLPNQALLEQGSPLAPFDQEFYLTIGLGIGGHNDFDDGIDWQVPKPWKNFAPNAQKDFWKSINQHNFDDWITDAAMVIKHIKIYSVEK